VELFKDCTVDDMIAEGDQVVTWAPAAVRTGLRAQKTSACAEKGSNLAIHRLMVERGFVSTCAETLAYPWVRGVR
jgi:hypothetical protein